MSIDLILIRDIATLAFVMVSLTIAEIKYLKTFQSKSWVSLDIVIVYLTGVSAFHAALFQHLVGTKLFTTMCTPILSFIASITFITAREWILSR